MVAVRIPSMRDTDELLRALESERNTFAAGNVMDRAAAEIARLRAALEKIAREQSHIDAQVAADLFQKIAQEALGK